MVGLAVVCYAAFATVVGLPSIVGSFGAKLAVKNIELFGLLAYLYPFVLLYGLYKIYRDGTITLKKATFVLSLVLLFVLFLLLQSEVFSGSMYAGKVGTTVVSALTPIIGQGGFWIIWLCSFVLSVAMLADEGVDTLFARLRHFFATVHMPHLFRWLSLPKRTPKEQPKEKKQPSKQMIVVADENKESVSPVIVEPLPSSAHTVDEEPMRNEHSQDTANEPDSSDEAMDGALAAAEEIAHVIDTLPKPIKRQTKQAKNDVLIVTELEENKALMSEIEVGDTERRIKGWEFPPDSFFAPVQAKKNGANEEEIDEKVKELIEKLSRFKIEGDVSRTYTGPVVTTFEFKPEAHIKVSRILTLQDDIAMALKAQTIRIQAPIPGKDVVGIEIPNREIETIYMRELIESDIFKKSLSPLTLILGKDIVGNPFITDLKKLPHLLIAGTTGSGKSVGINAMILSLLYKNSPDDLKLVMIDPKMLEFSMYEGIPHLLTPVITKPKQAINALANMVSEMERRYLLMSKTRTKNIENFNEKAPSVNEEKLPYIVVIIDELADLMMTSGKEVELSIARLAQMARASGIHLIVATQRPSVDVVTGLIKANLPSRVSFKVGQKIDSKVILDQMGAESLLGRGDMLFTPPGTSGVVRLHAPWSSEAEIEKVVDFLRNQRAPEYDESFLQEARSGDGDATSGNYDEGELDELYSDAKTIVLSERKSSISYIQRRLQIGYNRAARIVEQLEATGVLGAPNNKGNRDILE